MLDFANENTIIMGKPEGNWRSRPALTTSLSVKETAPMADKKPIPVRYLTQEQINIFWSYIEKLGPTDCWLWTGSKTADGYGHHTIRNGRKFFGMRVHRVAWFLTHGQIPDGMNVLHKCDVRACANPAHLFLGTCKDNSEDMVNKGRQSSGDAHYARTQPEKLSRGDNHYSRTNPERLARGDRSGARLYPDKYRGENNGRARLTVEDVLKIRRLSAEGWPQVKIAELYNTDKSNISHIVCRQNWKHIK